MPMVLTASWKVVDRDAPWYLEFFRTVVRCGCVDRREWIGVGFASFVVFVDSVLVLRVFGLEIGLMGICCCPFYKLLPNKMMHSNPSNNAVSIIRLYKIRYGMSRFACSSSDSLVCLGLLG